MLHLRHKYVNIQIEKFIENLENARCDFEESNTPKSHLGFCTVSFLKKSIPVLSKMEYNGNVCGCPDSVQFLGQRTKENDSS